MGFRKSRICREQKRFEPAHKSAHLKLIVNQQLSPTACVTFRILKVSLGCPLYTRKRTFRDHVYICPAGERLAYRFTNEERGLRLRRYWTTACQGCTIKDRCTSGKQRRITRWEHESVLEAVERRLEEQPEKMAQRRATVEHPFGTIKSWMGYTHFQTKTLKRVSTEMALHVLAYNLKRVMSIMGIGPLIAAISAA
jgi:hypothetical protein